MAFYEDPVYKVQIVRARFLVPKLIILLILGTIFYGGVLLNVALLDLNASDETMVKVVALAFVGGVVVLGVLLALRKVEKEYVFYRTWMEIGSEKVLYNSISSIETTTNVWDKLFHTSQIKIPGHVLRHVAADLNLHDYLQKLVDYAQR